MEPLPDEETRNLRRCARELAALSALSVACGHSDPPGIAESLAEVLARSLSLDFVYVRLASLAGGIGLEAVRTYQGAEAANRAHEVGEALAHLLVHRVSDPP